MVKPYLIAITGKQNTGKNTAAKLLAKGLDVPKIKFMAFADPIKKIAEQTFPKLPKKWLYGPSKFRNQIIPGASKNGIPLTVRQFLQDVGNDFGRKYNDNIWVDNFENRLIQLQQSTNPPDAIILTDCRFRSEYERLQLFEFYQIRILRANGGPTSTNISETNQDSIQNDEFDAIIDNNGTKQQLQEQVDQIIAQIKSQ